MGDARSIAIKILKILEQGRGSLDQLLDDEALEMRRFPHKRDRALLNALVYGVLRHRSRIDEIIGRFSRTPVPKLDPAVRNILRIGVYQIFYLDRVPDAAAVDTAVEAVKKEGKARFKGYVNGVLRNIVRNKAGIPVTGGTGGSPSEIAVDKSFPLWMLERWIGRFGREETIQLCDALNEIPPVTLRTHTLKTERRRLAEAAAREAERAELTERSDAGVKVFRLKTPLNEWKCFQDGWFQVQDEAAQLVSFLLDPKPGDAVLDLFAGFGGKTAHIADLMGGRGTVTVIDRDARKLDKLREEAERLGIECISETVVLDIETMKPFSDTAIFDKILVDAPCSGLGVIRRNPDIKWNRSVSMIAGLGARQRRFLEYASRYLKTGGVMVYAVCSMEPEETDAVIESFLHDHPEYGVDKGIENRRTCLQGLIDPSGCFRTFPHKSGMDGFFAVRLIKNA